MIIFIFTLLEQCPPGHYSDSGYNEKADPCMACPKGTYTWYNGTVDCTPCPEGSTTLQEGSTDEEQCISKFILHIYNKLYRLI